MEFNKQNWAMFSAFYPFRGGISQFSERLSRELNKTTKLHAFTFRVQYPSWLFPGKTQYQEPRSEHGLISAKRILSTFNPFTYITAAIKIRSCNPDVYITHQWMSFFAPFQWVLAKSLYSKTKRIAIVHNLVPHENRFFDPFLIRIFLSSFSNYIVLSDHVRQELIRRKPTANVKVLEHPWYDHFGEAVQPFLAKEKLGLDQNKKTLLFFGLIRYYKGLDILLEAFSGLSDSYQLIIAGEVYGDSMWLDELIRINTNKERIHLVNSFIPDEQVSTYFSAAECVVLPYRSATQSGVTAIAHQFQLPVVATNVGALPATIGDGLCGVLCEPENPADLKRAIETCFQLDAFQVQEAIKKRQVQYSWEKFVADLKEFVAICS